MKRRTLLQLIAAAPIAVPFRDVLLFAQPRELTPAAIAALHDIAPTVLPTTLGDNGARQVADKFVAWVRGYREGVALTHGYGHPRLQKSGVSPVARYVSQLTALAGEAKARDISWGAMDAETRRTLLDAAFSAAGVRSLPARPNGQHVVAD